ncbi:hypothetical protein IAI52_11070 [Pseudomonas lurida]|uniref:hypothetical protein n=1 Tax=Pseudomonas lurida TaxID=244566 RepID=UPI00165715D1|nr:hypothetical protein [Pseudomonas lurida]MBC8980785.1 hypothetical protein [Pseudomonas lurida]
MSRRNSTKGQRLIELFNALQRRETTFSEALTMSKDKDATPFTDNENVSRHEER